MMIKLKAREVMEHSLNFMKIWDRAWMGTPKVFVYWSSICYIILHPWVWRKDADSFLPLNFSIMTIHCFANKTYIFPPCVHPYSKRLEVNPDKVEITLLFIAIIFRRNIEYNSANVMWQEDLRNAFFVKAFIPDFKTEIKKRKRKSWFISQGSISEIDQ